MNGTTLLLIFFTFYFFIIFFYFLLKSKNNIIGYRVIKDPILYNNILTEEDMTYFNSLKNKYQIKDCTQMCSKEFCCEYQTQMIKYDLCKECKKENKCYDDNKGLCVTCTNNYTCEELFGCNNKPPLNPIKNYCTKCWIIH
jgi:hypothetical protein